eukprot:6476562-Amphidinium_carterae.2
MNGKMTALTDWSELDCMRRKPPCLKYEDLTGTQQAGTICTFCWVLSSWSIVINFRAQSTPGLTLSNQFSSSRMGWLHVWLAWSAFQLVEDTTIQVLWPEPAVAIAITLSNYL